MSSSVVGRPVARSAKRRTNSSARCRARSRKCVTPPPHIVEGAPLDGSAQGRHPGRNGRRLAPSRGACSTTRRDTGEKTCATSSWSSRRRCDLRHGCRIGESHETRIVARTATRSDVKNTLVSVTTVASWRMATTTRWCQVTEILSAGRAVGAALDSCHLGMSLRRRRYVFWRACGPACIRL